MEDKHKKLADDYRSGMTLQRCAEVNNCSIGSVRLALKKYGIPSRSKSGKPAPATTQAEELPRHRNALNTRSKPTPRPTRDTILKEAARACARLGGIAQIDGRYVVIDTTIYKAELR